MIRRQTIKHVRHYNQQNEQDTKHKTARRATMKERYSYNRQKLSMKKTTSDSTEPAAL